jgi:hemin uptake protein HemP
MTTTAISPSTTSAPYSLQPAPPQPLARPIASEDLLQGRNSLTIRHNGMLYRLQTTKLGKLILVK